MSNPRPPEPENSRALAEGAAWLSGLQRPPVAHDRRGSDPLAGMRRLLDALGNPHQGPRFIHIAGSKGKGSTALHLEGLLNALDRDTLTFTSPHLQRWSERFRRNGREIDADDALNALMTVRAAAESVDLRPGYFEALTATALVLAARMPAAWSIIEAGIGGRADATNVILPAISVITGIEMEHADRLGTTLAAIAGEKAGIIKPGVPVIVAEPGDEPAGVIRQAAETCGADLTWLRRGGRRDGTMRAGEVVWLRDQDHLHVAGMDWSVRCPCGPGGTVMAGNAALALATLATLGITDNEGLQCAARSIGSRTLPGRMEILGRDPWIMVDGAHTPESAAALAATIDELQAERVLFILSLTSGKDLAGVCRPLAARAERMIATCADAQWSLPAAELGRQLSMQFPQCIIDTVSTPDEAIALCLRNHAPGTLIVATGSVYLAGAIRGSPLVPPAPSGSCKD